MRRRKQNHYQRSGDQVLRLLWMRRLLKFTTHDCDIIIFLPLLIYNFNCSVACYCDIGTIYDTVILFYTTYITVICRSCIVSNKTYIHLKK